MIDEKEIESLRHTEYNSDPVIMEMLDTLSALWKVSRAAEEFKNCFPESEEIPEHAVVPLVVLEECLAALREEERKA